jgi:hypothetical protein
MLQRVRQEVEYFLDICRVTNGAYVETYRLCSNLFEVHFKIRYSFLEYVSYFFLNIGSRDCTIIFRT